MIQKTSKIGQGDIFLFCDEGSLVGLCMHDYKCLCAAAMIYATLVNIQTDNILTSLYSSAEILKI